MSKGAKTLTIILLTLAAYVRSFAQLASTSMAGSVAIVPALNDEKNQYHNP